VFDESPLKIWAKMQDFRDNFAQHRYTDFCTRCYKVAGGYL
jgi:hypothetical protein